MAYAYTGTVFAAPLAERDQQPSLFRRIYDAMIESRRRSAQRQINAHAHLFQGRAPQLAEMAAITLKTDSKLPFTG